MSLHTVQLSLMFLVSGAVALVFEALWFQQAALALGSSVWASAIVPAAFMGGLAIGNGLAARRGRRIRNPVRTYAVLEGIVAGSGLLLVLAFPGLSLHLPHWLAPLVDDPAMLNGVRMATAFALLLVPTAAMGLSLPLLVRHLHAREVAFGPSLGRLYGWNTLGAMAGVLLAGWVLVRRIGVLRTGCLTACVGLAVAAMAWRLGSETATAEPPGPASPPPRSRTAARFLIAGFLTGALLLGLEVLWFRHLLLFFPAVHHNFALMLAIVLGGIGCGGLAGAGWLRRSPRAARGLPHLLLLNGFLVVLAYSLFSRLHLQGMGLLGLSLVLMFPVSTVSGLAFTFLGVAVFDRIGEAARASGWLTVCNTLGGAAGALITGLALLSRIGVERSYAAAAALYGLAALLVIGADTRRRLALLSGVILVWVAGVAGFPHGAMERHLHAHFERTLQERRNMTRVAYRETATATLQYFEARLLGEPVSHRLVTNNHAMSGTMHQSRRYMKLYALLPAALLPNPRDALLIGFGCGSTARALTDEPAWRRIDIVDTSRETLELAEVVYPEPTTNPLNDPRVSCHIEDGRFFLQATRHRYDLITAEPPPPNYAGIAGLYSLEFFQRMRACLRPGGFVTYWLPVRQLSPADTRAILRAFTETFDNAGVWTGAGTTWMMMGWTEGASPAPADRFEAAWRRPDGRGELNTLGLPEPDCMGALFLADGDRLRAWIGNTPPLTDDQPHRLSPPEAVDRAVSLPLYREFMDPRAAADNFQSSPHIASIWPADRMESADAWFALRPVIDALYTASYLDDIPIRAVEACLDDPRLRPFLPLTLGANGDELAILRRTLPPGVLRGEVAFEEPDPRLRMKLAAHFLEQGGADAYSRAEALLAGIESPTPYLVQVRRILNRAR